MPRVRARPARPVPNPAARAALDPVGLLGGEGVRFTVLHVGSRGNLPELETPTTHGYSWDRVVRDGEPVEGIVSAARELEADLVVMATAGRHGLTDALRGSTTERVMRVAPCPVLAVPVSRRR